MFTAQSVVEVPLKPGDIFKDAEGVAWLMIHSKEPLAQIVWHLKGCTTSREEESTGENVSIASLKQPFTWIISMGDL